MGTCPRSRGKELRGFRPAPIRVIPRESRPLRQTALLSRKEHGEVSREGALDSRHSRESGNPRKTTSDGKCRTKGEVAAGLEVCTSWRPGQPRLDVDVDGTSFVAQIEVLDATSYRLSAAGHRRTLKVLRRRAGELFALMPAKQGPDASSHIVSPMPGLLIEVGVREGDEVKAGHPVAVVEAMKMENVLRAPGDGVVARILASPGETLSVGQTIIELDT